MNTIGKHMHRGELLKNVVTISAVQMTSS